MHATIGGLAARQEHAAVVHRHSPRLLHPVTQNAQKPTPAPKRVTAVVASGDGRGVTGAAW